MELFAVIGGFQLIVVKPKGDILAYSCFDLSHVYIQYVSGVKSILGCVRNQKLTTSF